MFAHLTLCHLPAKISKAFDTALSAAHTSVLVLLVDRGLNRAVEELPRAELGPVLHTTLLTLSKDEWRAYYDELVETPTGMPDREQEEDETQDTPTPDLQPRPDPLCSPTAPCSLSPASSLTSYSSTSTHGPTPQMAC